MSPAVSGNKTGWEIARIVLKSAISFKKKQGFPVWLRMLFYAKRAFAHWPLRPATVQDTHRHPSLPKNKKKRRNPEGSGVLLHNR